MVRLISAVNVGLIAAATIVLLLAPQLAELAHVGLTTAGVAGVATLAGVIGLRRAHKPGSRNGRADREGRHRR